MANNQITPFQLTDQFTMDNFNQRINETNTALQNKADTSSVYTKEESISAETRTALSLAETATPDDALSEIARQLSDRLVLLWENASPNSDFMPQTISLDLSKYKMVLITIAERKEGIASSTRTYYSAIVPMGLGRTSLSVICDMCFTYRYCTVNVDSIAFENGCWLDMSKTSNWETVLNSLAIPLKIYGIK